MMDALTQIARQLIEINERLARLEAIEHPFATPGNNSILMAGAGGTSVGSWWSAILAGQYNELTTASFHSIVSGLRGKSQLQNSRVMGGGQFAATGDAQISETVLMLTTTSATPSIMRIQDEYNIVVPTNTAWHCWLEIIARKASGADHAAFVRRCVIENTAGTTALVGAVQTIGTDIASGGAGAWAVAITADNANDALQVQVTGQAATNIRWVAWVRMVEVGYA